MPRPRKSPILTDEQVREYFEDTVKQQGNTGRVYPPKSWVGSKVRITKLE